MAKPKPKLSMSTKPRPTVDEDAARELEERFARRGGELPESESRISPPAEEESRIKKPKQRRKRAGAAQLKTRWTRKRDGAALHRTTVHLPEPLYKRLKHHSVDARRSLSEIAEEALTQWLDAEQSRGE